MLEAEMSLHWFSKVTAEAVVIAAAAVLLGLPFILAVIALLASV